MGERMEKLKIIGERINPGFRSTKRLFDNEDVAGIASLARDQAAQGASYLNINLGELAAKKPGFMVQVIRAVQEQVAVPLSFDSPDVNVQALFLRTYDEQKAGGATPIVNSISELRWEMLELLKIRKCRFVLMASEREQNGRRIANRTAQEVYQTALRMATGMTAAGVGLALDDLFIDVSIGPIGADMDGFTRMAVDAIRAIGASDALKGVHMSVGLSNIGIMLPKLCSDGSALQPQIESAFLTLTVPYGLDTVLGTAGRGYAMLPDDNRVLQGVRESLELDGVDAILRIQQLYRSA